jgi:hypothetical protein
MKLISKALVATSALVALSATGIGQASAAIVCSGDDCWHTHSSYEYPAEAHVIVHDDNWRWGSGDHFHWREHEGRGFWHGNDWREF